MEIILGKTAGFCYGVKRAVEGAKREIEKVKSPIYCLGEIVHNKQVIEMLKRRGLTFIEDINLSKGNTIIRAHGVKKEIYNIAKKNNIKIKDYTCPNVLKIHKIVKEYSKNGYYIFLCGSNKHPENIGTISYCTENSDIIETENEVFKALEKFKQSKIKKLLIISQTTYSLEKFYIIEEIIKNEVAKDIELVIKNTICRATELRQKETKEISKQVDDDKRACYFKQVEYGKYIRMALIMKLLNEQNDNNIDELKREKEEKIFDSIKCQNPRCIT